jgi:hypothetical protein
VKAIVTGQRRELKPLAVVEVRIPTLHRWIEIESGVVDPEVPRRREQVGGEMKPVPDDPEYLRKLVEARELRKACQVADAIDAAEHGGKRPLSAQAAREEGEKLLREAHAGVLVGVYNYLREQVLGVAALYEPFLPAADGELSGAGDAAVPAAAVESGAMVDAG